MCGTAALVAWKVEDRMMAMMSSHLSSGKSWTGDTNWGRGREGERRGEREGRDVGR
jgi:hypothetical protein